MENLVALAITLLVLVFVGYPLLREKKQQQEVFADEADQDPEIDHLLSQKETALAAIRELEFDHAVGNLSDSDYQELKEKYERRAISLLKTLDEVGKPGTNGHGRNVKPSRVSRGDRRQPETFRCPACGMPYEEGDLFCGSCGTALSEDLEPEDGEELGQGPVCPNCGEPYEEDDSFCASCGAHLLAENEYAGGYAADGDNIAEEEAAQDAEETDQPAGQYRSKRTRRGGRQRKASTNGKGAR